MEALLKVWTGYLASGVEGIAGLIIMFVVIFALRTFLKRFFLWERARLQHKA